MACGIGFLSLPILPARNRDLNTSTLIPKQTDRITNTKAIPGKKKKMSSSKNIFFLLLLLFFALPSPLSPSVSCNPTPPIGVTYSQDLPDLQRIVSTVQSLGITRVRLPDPNPTIIRSFAYSGISLLLSIPNTFIPQFASNSSHAADWLSTHVVPFYPRTRIAIISVGNDALTSSQNLSHLLLPAIRNVHLALHELRIPQILVSTTFSFDIIQNPFPPSAAEFREHVSVLKSLLEFLYTASSSFLINAYPYDLYRSNPEIPIGFALFQDQPLGFRDDPVTGLRYRNLFDVMIDSLITAMGAVGHKGIPVVVTETGWPSEGDTNDTYATELYARMFNAGLVKYLKSGLGTPLRREGVAEAYIFELFDEDMKQGAGSKQHWGILHLNMTAKYEIDFSGSIQVRGGGSSVGLMELVACFWLLFVFLQLRWR